MSRSCGLGVSLYVCRVGPFAPVFALALALAGCGSDATLSATGDGSRDAGGDAAGDGLATASPTSRCRTPPTTRRVGSSSTPARSIAIA